MKKSVLLSLVIAIASVSFANAQCVTTSYGITQSWSMPYAVYNTVYNNYHGYEMVHTTQLTSIGIGHFEVVLQRGNVFVRIDVDAHGHIHKRVINSYNPIANHACNSHCGFHSTYYNTHHDHFTKNVYVHNSHNHNYGYKQSNKVNHQKREDASKYYNNGRPDKPSKTAGRGSSGSSQGRSSQKDYKESSSSRNAVAYNSRSNNSYPSRRQ